MNEEEVKKLFKKIEGKMNILIADLKHKYKNKKDIEAVPLLPSFPNRKVKYIFVASEPSLGRWAKDEKEAKEKIKKGFKNFLFSGEDFCFHYSISEFLSPSYYLTDISKIAMKIKNVKKIKKEKEIYPKCLDLLKEEIDIIGLPNAKIFFVSRAVENFLRKNNLDKEIEKREVIGTIPHYSKSCSAVRMVAPILFKEEFEIFLKNSEFSDDNDILEFAENLLNKNEFEEEIKKEILKKLKRGKKLEREEILSNSRIELIFTYKKIFEIFKNKK